MRRRLLMLFAVAAVPAALWAVLPVGSAGAPSAGSIAHQIASKEAQIRAHRGREAVLTTDISHFTQRIDSIQRDIGRLQARRTKLESDLVVKRAQLAQVQTRLRQERLRLAKLKTRFAQAKIVLARRLVEIYEADRPDIVTVVLEARGFQDLLERADFIHRISSQDKRIIAAVRAAKARATASAQRLSGLEQHEARVTAAIQSETDQVAGVENQLVERRTSFVSARSQKAQLLSSSQIGRHKLEDDVASLRRQQQEIAARLARAAAASSGVAAGPIRQGGGSLIWPVNGPITSPFCQRRAWEACHPGIDIGVPSGTPVRAAATGRVALIESVGQSGGYGNYICIQHAGPLSTCYAHLMRFLVGMGQVVQQGQVIAISDCTGLCFGPHLHFETRVNGQVVNPMNYL